MTLPERYFLNFDERSPMLKLCDDGPMVPSEDAFSNLGLKLSPAWPPLNEIQPTLNLFKLVDGMCLGQRNVWWLSHCLAM